MQVLTEAHEEVLKNERRILNDLRSYLVEFGAEASDKQALAESIAQLDELFLLVIVGEFNAGKSAFINALLGDQLLEEGVTPTTTQINILRFGETSQRSLVKENQLVQLLPVEWLAEINIVDTPGTNAIIRSHEAITSEFIPRSDLVIFITSADRPFTESERLFLEHIRDWGKKIVMVINKIDILQDEKDISQVIDFISTNTYTLLGVNPMIFPISARLAMRAKKGEVELWEASRFEALEDYIRNTLDNKSRLQLKLLNPLGVGAHLSDRYLGMVFDQLHDLSEDTRILDDVDAQLKIYRQDLERDFQFRLADIENVLFEMEIRGQNFYDNTFRLTRVFDLLGKERIRSQFESQVIADVPKQIEKRVHELIDWLVDSDLHQWQAVNDHLAERRRAYQNRIVGETGPGNFYYDRERLVDSVAAEAQRVVDTYDRTEEALKIAQGAQDAVATSAILEVGAIGLGAIITAIATTTAVDVTGILLATMIATLGFVIIPAKRRAGKIELTKKIQVLREQLVSTLQEHFEKEIQRSISNINNAIAPYTRFIRAEQIKLTETQSKLEETRLDMDRIKEQIEGF